MSSASRRRRTRRTSAGTRTPGRRRQRRQTDENEEPEIQVLREEAGTCIDLTAHDDNDNDVVVDLTSVNDSPIVILSSTSTPGSDSITRHELRRRALLDSDSSDSELEEVPFHVELSPPKKLRDAASADNSAGVLSPEGRTITCPICFDTDKQMKANKKKVFSTTCGHIFCSECIRVAIQTQKKCPTCRKKLSKSQVHPLFL